MNFQALLACLPLLVTLTNAQTTPLAHYNEVCPSNNGQEVQLEPGVFVTYHCGTETRVPITGSSASDPDTCVRTCAADATCQGSIWSGRSGSQAGCFLVQNSNEASLQPKLKVVWMELRRQDSTSGGDNFPDSCEDELEDSQDALATCQQQNEQLQLELDTCRNPAVPEAQCPDSNGQIVVVGDKQWRITCGRWSANATDFGNSITNTLQECVEKCALDSRCHHAVWKNNSRLCYLRSTVAGTLDRTSANHQTAVLVE